MSYSICLIILFLLYCVFCAGGLILLPFIGPLTFLLFLSLLANISFMCVNSHRLNLHITSLQLLACCFLLVIKNGVINQINIGIFLILVLISMICILGSREEYGHSYSVILKFYYIIIAFFVSTFAGVYTLSNVDFELTSLYLIFLAPVTAFTILLKLYGCTKSKKIIKYSISFLSILIIFYIYSELGFNITSFIIDEL